MRADRRIGGAGVTVAAVLLAGCSMAPAYQPPQTSAPAEYKEVAGWTAAQPADAVDPAQSAAQAFDEGGQHAVA
ncbi:MAG: hypothetical protein J7517_17910, partial [Sphingobium yanoikuyae]|nr:hypothetical protein [Sphingobium yanoikuyae]